MCAGSNTVGHEPALGLVGDNAACTWAVIVMLVVVLDSRNRSAMSPLVLLLGVPPVATTDTVPAVTVSTSLVFTLSGFVPPVTRFVTVVVPV